MQGEGCRIVIAKTGREDAQDGITLSIERNIFPYKCRVSGIALLPQPITQNGRTTASFFFVWNKQTAVQRLNTQNAKQAGGYSLPGNLLRCVVSGQIERHGFKSLDLVEYMVLFFPVEQLSGGNNAL